jgi:hypothetical protein
MKVLATAKVEAVAPEGGEALLIQFLKSYRDAVQYVVNIAMNSLNSFLLALEASNQNICIIPKNSIDVVIPV